MPRIDGARSTAEALMQFATLTLVAACSSLPIYRSDVYLCRFPTNLQFHQSVVSNTSRANGRMRACILPTSGSLAPGLHPPTALSWFPQDRSDNMVEHVGTVSGTPLQIVIGRNSRDQDCRRWH